jgi:hypothetical protein
MNRRTCNALLAAVLLFASCVASADIDIALYRKLRASDAKSPARDTLRVYVSGLKDGLEMSNGFLMNQGKPQVFCSPSNLALNVENYLQFIDESLSATRDGPLKETYPISLVVVQLLQSKFPCSS